MTCILISGEIRDIRISRGYEDMVFDAKDKPAIGIGSVVAAASGSALSSTVLASSSHGAEISMEFFSCRVDDREVEGRFHKVGFKEGDWIELVVSIDGDKAEVQAARDPRRGLIWTLPYHTRGHVAQKRSDIKASLIISTGLAILAPSVSFSNSQRSGPALFIEVLWLAVPLFLISLSINFFCPPLTQSILCPRNGSVSNPWARVSGVG